MTFGCPAFAQPLITGQQITAPYTISSPGTYELSADCRGSGKLGDCDVTIAASDVTLDGKGHALFSSGVFVQKSGSAPLGGITIKNIWLEGGGSGIILSGTTGVRISDVTIVETVSDGLSIYDSTGTRVENSVFLKDVDMILDPMYENMYHGAILLEGAKNVVITGCSFEDHFNAIVLRDATDTTISSNYFHNNRDVMYHSAEGTKIFDNYLSVVTIDGRTQTNALNTTLQPGINIIGGTKMGGNYWYTDDGKGYSQTCVDDNHSGICNRPYVIGDPSGLNETLRTDYFPLCGPVAPGTPVHTVITPKAVHTIPTAEVYHHTSPTLPTPIPFDLSILSAVTGAIVAGMYRKRFHP